MLSRTHLAVTLFLLFFIINFFENKVLFVSIALVSSLIPDIDTRFSFLGKYRILRPLQFFSKHRGFFHSFAFLSLSIFVFWIFIPVFFMPFLVGYGTHIFLDCLTPSGVRFFYPFKKKFKGKIRTGGKIEWIIFSSFLVADVLFIGYYFFNLLN